MTPLEIDMFLDRMRKQKLKIGRSIHRLIDFAEQMGGFQFAMCDIYKLQPAQ